MCYVTLSISVVSVSFGLVVGEYSTLRKVLNPEKYRVINIDGEVLEM